jgi:hypothetical protein
MKTVGFCHKKNQSTHIKIGDLGVQPKKWFLKNVAPWEIDMGLNARVGGLPMGRGERGEGETSDKEGC